MSIAAKFLLAAPIALAVSLSTGCDSDDSPSPTDYRAVAHVDLAAAKAAPWIKKALGTKALDLGGDLGPCADVLRAARSITAGTTADHDFEVYLTGKLDADQANGCADHLEKLAKRSGKKAGASDEPEAVMLDGDLFAVYRGAITPSRARLDALLAANPSPSAAKQIWLIAQPDAKSTNAPVAYVQAWAETGKGLDAHVDVQFKDETVATELYGKAMLGLAAIQLSGEVDELVKGFKLGSQGDTLTGDLHLEPKAIAALIGKGSAHAKVHASDEAGSDDHALTISISAEK